MNFTWVIPPYIFFSVPRKVIMKVRIFSVRTEALIFQLLLYLPRPAGVSVRTIGRNVSPSLGRGCEELRFIMWTVLVWKREKCLSFLEVLRRFQDKYSLTEEENPKWEIVKTSYQNRKKQYKQDEFCLWITVESHTVRSQPSICWTLELWLHSHFPGSNQQQFNNFFCKLSVFREGNPIRHKTGTI